MNDARRELCSKLEAPSYTADDYELMAEAANEISYLAKRVEALERAAPPPQAESRGEEAAQDDVVETLAGLQRYEESCGEGGGVYQSESGDFIRLSDAIDAIASQSAKEPK
ncbi:hypothetical protein [Caballeronia sp. ATUFL_M2_KS44]|uniref:hypothetical protein n=1 Tax=Caballeronia sp. ATUFL_M2_KS44 TaxID=2921767 RepID=UPI00202836C1|nr:hypothetical protein [Caballeronia sp. ATUFL_M2_KS44]